MGFDVGGLGVRKSEDERSEEALLKGRAGKNDNINELSDFMIIGTHGATVAR